MRKTVGKRIRARWPIPVIRARVERLEKRIEAEEEWDNDRIPNNVLFPLFDSMREDIDELEDKVKLLEKHYDVRLDEMKTRFERMFTLIRAVWMTSVRSNFPRQELREFLNEELGNGLL